MSPGPSAGRRSPAIWIGVALVAIGGVIVSAAAATRGGRGHTDPVAIAPEADAHAAHEAHEAHAVPATLADASRVVSIEMYSAAWCQACSRAKAWMRDQGITYHEVDVDRRAGALAQLQMLNPRRSLPTFDVDGQVLVGFEEARLRAAIDDAARRR
ncbi:glutaredoxin family protein [Sandaracinus amylolyticus]|uniref:Glutaredoxin domain-containing protein n=1 Tax=Sandaracinus amylolyticus TaxID=927083 RepID=A0A0F6W8C7_9BACT|nr:glutaredoxin family protein [Sandaracinus amylolyticus]AKF09902.1 hypothetical protein DB32_007051 [Sandaracinus amylolyticus]